MAENNGAIKVPIEPELKKEELEKQIDSILGMFKRKWKGFTEGMENTIRTVLKAYPKLISELNSLTTLKDVKSKVKSWSPLATNISATQKKIGYDPSMKVFSSKEAIGSEIERIKGMDTELWDKATIDEALNTLEKKQQAFINAEKQITELVRKRNTEEEKQKAIIRDNTEEIQRLKQEFLELSQQEGTEIRLQKITEQIDKLDQEARNAKAQLDKMADSKKLSSFGKFMNRFKSYLNVRLLRNFFSQIEKYFGESIKNLASFSPEVNETLSSIQSSFKIMSDSLISMLVPILETLAPILQQIASAVANVANGFNQASAKAKGLSTYTKINADYMKDFSEETSSSLLSFDKFETLSGSSDAGSYSTGDVEEILGETSEFGAELYEMLQLILDIIKQIWDIVSPLIGSIISLINPILEIVNVLLSVLSPVLSSIIDLVGGVLESFEGAFEIISGLLYLLTGDFDKAWEKIGSGFKKLLQGFVDQIISLFNLIIDVLNLAFIDANPIFWVLKAFNVNVDKVRIPHIPSVQLFANGGLVDSGSLFIAGESGAEFVTKMPSGQTGVTNIAQFREAQLEALSTWWAYAKYDLPDSATFNLDGAEIARSKSFKAELNRTNAGLNLK